MTKSELIERMTEKLPQLSRRDVELAVNAMLEHISARLASGGRIEIRGFGSFSLHFRPGRLGRNPRNGAPVLGRNPRNGAPVALPPKHVPYFKPGKALREAVTATLS